MSRKLVSPSWEGLAKRRALRRPTTKRPGLRLEQLEDRLVLTTYDVGPGQPLATVGAVPWNNLQPGDVVNIHWQANAYHEKIILSNSGTPLQHIVINGIAGPQGQLPVLDGANATSSPNSPQFGYTPLQDFGLIVIYRDNTKPYTYQPSNIDINNLQLQGAIGGTNYTGYAGDSRIYATGAGGIWTEGSVNLTIHGCIITNNDNGIFAKSAGGPGTTYNITLDSNYLYGNGVVSDYLEHDSYVEAYGALYQYNHYGPLRNGAWGNALKDRSSSTIIRYNYIQDGGHLLDLDEPQDGYADISTDPNYLRTLVYGNALVSDVNGPTFLVHYGDGGGVGKYRNGGVLYFYDNTVINQADQSDRWRTNVFQMETNQVSTDARNNVFFNTPNTSGGTPSFFEFGLYDGNINFATSNWVSPGWYLSESQELGQSYNGTISGTNNFITPANNNPGFANLATYDAHLSIGSGAIGRGGLLASAVATSYPVTMQYVYNQSSQPRLTMSDLGAFAFAGSLSLGTSVTTSTAGSAFTVTVTAKDGSGNIVTGYTGTVHFTSSDAQAGLPLDYTFTPADAGVHIFTVALKTAGPETITATDTSMTGSASVTVTAAAASQLAVSGFPNSATAGTTGSVTVTAQDPYGNVAQGYLGSVHFTSSDSQAGLPADYTFVSSDNGVHSFSVTLKTAGAESITATDKAAATITGTESGITVAAAAANKITLSGFPTSVTAGVSGNVTVTAQDAYGNLAKSYTGTVHFTSSDSQAVLPADYTFVSGDQGAHSFSVTLRTAATASITATDKATATITGSQSGITVTAATASKLVVSGLSAMTAGAAGTATLTAQDAYGNLAKGYTGTVHFTSSDSQAVLPADYTFVGSDNGVHSFNVTLKTAGTESITATDKATATITGTQSGITVAAAAASKLVVSGFPVAITAGAPGTVIVTADDAFGNVATGYTGTVHFISTDTQATLPANYTFLSTDRGSHSFAVILKTTGNQAITATDQSNASITGTQSGISVTAAPAQLVVSGFPSTTTAGTTGAITVTAKDSLGNLAAGYTGTVHFTSTDVQAGLPADYKFVSTDLGSHSFNVTFKTSGSQSVTAKDLANASLTGTESGITVVPGPASQLAFTAQSASSAAGAVISPAVTVKVFDAYGNMVSSDNSDRVTLTVASGPAGFTSGSITSVTVSGGVATFANLAFANAGAYTISANTAGLITAAAAAHVARIGPPPTWLTPEANNLTHSAEYYSLIVTAAYQRFLGRTPDSTGLANWVAQMQQGLTDEHLEAGFIGSPEYIQTHGGAGAGWITGMYQNLLGRTPSQAEVTSWLQALAMGASTTNIAYGFAASAEREGQRVTADYQQYLGRTPTAAEVASWVNVFVSGAMTNENVVAGFVGSTEYFNKHYRNASDWLAAAYQAILGVPASQAGATPSFLPAVSNTLTHSAEYYSLVATAAYQNYLGRTPDSTGLANWVALMQQGLSDEHLEAGFIGSPEFIQNHGGLGAGWITAMYQSLLGRSPSPIEVSNWLQVLARGVSTTTVAYGFAASAEREGQRVTADYQQYLARTPTAAEVASWVNLFESGAATNENVVAGFVGSVEYFQRRNGDSQDWWNQAVQALFGAGGF